MLACQAMTDGAGQQRAYAAPKDGGLALTWKSIHLRPGSAYPRAQVDILA